MTVVILASQATLLEPMCCVDQVPVVLGGDAADRRRPGPDAAFARRSQGSRPTDAIPAEHLTTRPDGPT
jgi:hypothetical protein